MPRSTTQPTTFAGTRRRRCGCLSGTVSDATLPLGGVKQSGLGREGGSEGLQEYLETQALTLGS